MGITTESNNHGFSTRRDIQMKSKLFILLAASLMSQGAFAYCEKTRYYVGAGVASNSVDNFSDSTGMQFLGGYCLDSKILGKKSKTAIEVGYMKTGDFENDVTTISGGGNGNGNGNQGAQSTTTGRQSYDGMWASAVAEYKLDPKFNFVARLGMDIGDDNGLMYGLGAAFHVTKLSQIRAEVVERDTVGSLQLNWISDFD
jgi:hypothetical protein